MEVDAIMELTAINCPHDGLKWHTKIFLSAIADLLIGNLSMELHTNLGTDNQRIKRIIITRIIIFHF